jgi:DtxR family transcriptional regulator, Mn-dependent transcriptional regulator
MTTTETAPQLTPSLEDYLETIFELVRDRRVARVRDIAKARNVRAGSVTSALHRLSDLGLIRYEQREYIDLTPAGSKAALRVLSRHRLLTSFFEDILNMATVDADRDACAIEHHLSDEAMDRLTRLFEFLRSCPNSSTEFLERFHHCARVNPELPTCNLACGLPHPEEHNPQPAFAALADLVPGESGSIVQVKAHGEDRQGLLDMGFLPDVVLRVERVDPVAATFWIRIGSGQLSIRRDQAELVKIVRVDTAQGGEDRP